MTEPQTDKPLSHDEYQELNRRTIDRLRKQPNLSTYGWAAFLVEAEDREAELLGKLDAATRLLGTISQASQRAWSEDEVAATIRMVKNALADLRPEETNA